MLQGPKIPPTAGRRRAIASIVPQLYPLPRWEIAAARRHLPRVRARRTQHRAACSRRSAAELAGQLQRIEEPGRPDIRQSNRGPGTGARIAVPVINITRRASTIRSSWFLGTNDQPGDYRSFRLHRLPRRLRQRSRSAAFRRRTRSSATTAQSQTADPTIPQERAGPSAAHTVHARGADQPVHDLPHAPAELFVNTYLGYTMWDYETDAPRMWPKKQQYPTEAEKRASLDRNPEGAATRGNVERRRSSWRTCPSLNPQLKDTQFADYHGHGWNFRAVYKRDRKGNLLDADGNVGRDRRSAEIQEGRAPARHPPRDAACTASTATSRRTSTATARSTASRQQRSRSSARTATAPPTQLPNLRTSGPAAPPAAPT